MLDVREGDSDYLAMEQRHERATEERRPELSMSCRCCINLGGNRSREFFAQVVQEARRHRAGVPGGSHAHKGPGRDFDEFSTRCRSSTA
jgi:hypothetical protein